MSTLASTNSTVAEQPAIDVAQDEEAVGELVTSLKTRLVDVNDLEMRHLVTTALGEFGPVRVTNFLPILVERRVRDLRAEELAGTQEG